MRADTKPKFFPTDSPGGLYVTTRRDAGTDRYYWRVTQWLMPCFSFFPPYGDNPYGGHAFVPIDDESCWTFSIDYHPRRPLSEAELRGDARRQGHPRQADARARSRPPRTSATTTRWTARGRRRRRRSPACYGVGRAGRRGAGEHGTDPGPRARASRFLGQQHPHGAAAAARGGGGGRARRRAAGARSRRCSSARAMSMVVPRELSLLDAIAQEPLSTGRGRGLR